VSPASNFRCEPAAQLRCSLGLTVSGQSCCGWLRASSSCLLGASTGAVRLGRRQGCTPRWILTWLRRARCQGRCDIREGQGLADLVAESGEVEYVFAPAGGGLNSLVAAGGTPQDVLRMAIDWLVSRRSASCRVGVRGTGREQESALLFRTEPRQLHVVGDQPVAGELRAVLQDGLLPGWRLRPMSDNHEPLHALQPTLTTRHYALLERNGFATVEEVVATPDEGLLSVHGAGPRFIAAVRAATADRTSTDGSSPVHTSAAELVADRRQRLHDRLDPPQRLRYRDFAELLAASAMPATALNAIADALNIEPLPPADPLVILLLQTAGETSLLDHYTATHCEPAHATEHSPSTATDS
jgi:hypothetical protein